MKSTSVFLATYSIDEGGETYSLCGPIHYIINYLRGKFLQVAVLEQPLPQATVTTPSISHYNNRDMTSRKKFPKFLSLLFWVSSKRRARGNTILRFKLRDLFSSLYFGLFEQQIDLYIGVECVNAFCGILLRRLGKVNQVVYYVIDYAPQRYKNKWLNSFYLKLDRIAATRADFVWNNSPFMHQSRLERDIPDNLLSPQVIVPSGCPFKEEDILPLEKRNANQIIYSGDLIEAQGVHLLLQAMPQIVQQLSNVKLIITGRGTDEDKLRLLSQKLNLEKHVFFTGYISEPDLHNHLKYSVLGIAPFLDNPITMKRYADPGKIRRYLAFGIPVITTDVPYVSKDLARKNAGILIKPDISSLENTILRLLTNSNELKFYISNAIEMARTITWECNWDRAFSYMDQLA